MERGCRRTWSLSACVMLKRSEASPREVLGGTAVSVRSADRLRRGFLPVGQDDDGKGCRRTWSLSASVMLKRSEAMSCKRHRSEA